MKPQDPSIIEVTYSERSQFGSSPCGEKKPYSRLQKDTIALSSNGFFKPLTYYVLLLLVDGFKISIPRMHDTKLLKTRRCGRMRVTGVEPGLYEIVEQSEDHLIAKKIQPS